MYVSVSTDKPNHTQFKNWCPS